MFVSEVARMEDFYTRLLDFTVTDRGQLAGPNGPMDLVSDLADEATLVQRLEAHARTLPGFRPREEWRADMARRMGLA
jgi:hypothetical protein